MMGAWACWWWSAARGFGAASAALAIPWRSGREACEGTTAVGGEGTGRERAERCGASSDGVRLRGFAAAGRDAASGDGRRCGYRLGVVGDEEPNLAGYFVERLSDGERTGDVVIRPPVASARAAAIAPRVVVGEAALTATSGGVARGVVWRPATRLELDLEAVGWLAFAEALYWLYTVLAPITGPVIALVAVIAVASECLRRVGGK
jgi:hypothetical protein